MSQKNPRSNVWKSFDVRKETQKHAIHRRHLLDYSDQILFNNDPNLTPKRTRDKKIEHALSKTPAPKRVNDNDLSDVGYVEVPYRRIVHELFTEDTNELDDQFRKIGIEPINKTPKKWGTPLSKKQVNEMTMDDMDANHKRLQVQDNLDYATGMARKSGTRVIEQLITEDRKRAEDKALRDKWLEHRKRLKRVDQPRIVEHSSSGGKSSSRRRDRSSRDRSQQPASKHQHHHTTHKHTHNQLHTGAKQKPIAMLGIDESKPIYGIRRIENIDDIIERSKKRGGLKMDDLDPTTVVLRCAAIRKNSVDDLLSLQMSLDNFLKNELEFEEKRHDIKNTLNARFDLLKKQIDHSVSVGGSDYKYDDQFRLNSKDKQTLKRIKNSVKYRRNKALSLAEHVRKGTMNNMQNRRMDQKRLRLGLRPRHGTKGMSGGLASGGAYDEAAAKVLQPKANGVHSMRYK